MLDEELEEINKAKSYTTTQAMRNNAKRGLELRKKYSRGGLSTQEAGKQGIGSGVARASDIISGSLSLESVKRMHSFFSRHEKNIDASKRESDGGYTAGYISGLLWGGSSGKAWARGILRREGLLKSMDKLQVVKSANQELKQATFIAMLPDSVDLHGDYTSAEEVRKAMESFNKSEKRTNLFHISMSDSFSVIESYLAPVDFMLNDEFVAKGTWLMTLQVNEDSLWELIKSGEINGISIGARANVETIDEEDE